MENDLIKVVDNMSIENVDKEVSRTMLLNMGMSEIDAARAILNGMYKDIEQSDNMFYDTVVGEYGVYKNQPDMIEGLNIFVNKYGVTPDLNITALGIPRNAIINDTIIIKRGLANIDISDCIIVDGDITICSLPGMLEAEIEEILEDTNIHDEIYVIEDGCICNVELIMG